MEKGTYVSRHGDRSEARAEVVCTLRDPRGIVDGHVLYHYTAHKGAFRRQYLTCPPDMFNANWRAI